MPLIKDDAVTEDAWRELSDDAPLGGDDPVIISYDRWKAGR